MGFSRKPPFALRARPLSRTRPRVEELESRITPYAISGSSWVHPQLITISFVPDGTIVGASGSSYIHSNLFAAFNARFGSTAKWENAILKGAQLWAQQANVNFTVVSDNGATIGSGPDQQGDPNMGDVRISGFNYGTSTLATTDLPPQVNNYSVSGDQQYNTAAPFNINTTYDLTTVAAHEFGHSLGLEHSNVYQAEMYPNYTTVKQSLNADDIAGIQAVYGTRQPDAYDAAASNGTFATASDVTSTIDPVALTAVVNNLDITTTSDLDYYTLTAPANTSGTMTVTVQSQGLSLLSPTLTVYDANQNQLGTVSGINKYGTTLTLTLSNVTAGAQYYVKVGGADTTAFSTGAYALTLNFGTGANPTVPLPNTTTPNGNPLSAGGGLAEVPTPGADGPGVDSFSAGSVETAAAVAAAAAAPQGQAAPAAAPVQAVHTVTPVPLAPAAVPVVSAAIMPSPVIISAAAAPASVAELAAPPSVPVQQAAARPTTSIPDGGGTVDTTGAVAEAGQDTPVVTPDQPVSLTGQAADDQPATPAAQPVTPPDDAFWAAPPAEQEAPAAWQSLESSAPALDSAAAGLAAALLWCGQPRQLEEERRRAAAARAS